MTVSDAFRNTVAALLDVARAAEARTSLTTGHSERVARVTAGMAEAMELPAAQKERLRLAALLHNIGTLAVRDSVLLKTDRLSALELDHIQQHTVLGAKLVSHIPELDDVAEVCLTHHERWNGSGYPNGLIGQEIPPLARIIAVADTYCAITSERPHRDSLPAPVAADILAEERKQLFCPDCVDGFLLWYAKTDGRI